MMHFDPSMLLGLALVLFIAGLAWLTGSRGRKPAPARIAPARELPVARVVRG